MASSLRRKRTLQLCLCMTLCVFLMVMILYIGNSGPDKFIVVGGTNIPFSSLNGVLDAFITLLCIVMVAIENKRGSSLALLALTLSMIPALRPVVFAHSYVSLPSIANTMIMMIIILILRRMFEKREKDGATDYLTGLLNRRGLMKALYDRDDKQPYYFMYIDIDDFKFINDNLGHECGDQVLIALSNRMSEIAMKTGRDAVVGRVGGDEFVIVVSGSTDMKKLSADIITAITDKFTVNCENSPTDCYVSGCLGIAAYPEDSKSHRTIMKYADIAMYQAKSGGKNKCCSFDKKIEAELLRQAELEGIIKESLDKGYFYLVYQPQYHTENKKLRGFETLLRLKTPDGNFVSPGEFIPAAEKTELILKIDEFVVRRAMQEFAPTVKKCGESFSLSINVSAKNICRRGFAEMVRNAAEETGFPYKCLEIEITEYCLVQSLDTAIQNINELKALGVQIALDDFGTGYASLSYLSKLSVDLLKIDKSFIDEIDKDEKSNDFISAVISIGHIHDCKVISEGVEHENQLALLLSEGCDFIQGYIWGRPISLKEAIALSETCSIWVE